MSVHRSFVTTFGAVIRSCGSRFQACTTSEPCRRKSPPPPPHPAIPGCPLPASRHPTCPTRPLAATVRWVHVDPCEASFDRPLLYESGWGKQLSYVFAIGTSGFVDVIRRYTRKWSEVQPRRLTLTEAELAAKLADLNSRIRFGMQRDILNQLTVRDLAEQLVRISIKDMESILYPVVCIQ